MQNAPLRILVVGREMPILAVIQRLIDAHDGWEATVVTTVPAALEAFGRNSYPIVFVGAGFSAGEEEDLRTKLLQIDPSVVVTRHYGGGSGLLENEVLSILAKTSQPDPPASVPK
jgi:hypothetical protein